MTTLGSLARGAVGNARRSLDELSRAMTDRARVHEQTGEPGDIVPIQLDECLALLRKSTIGRVAYIARAGVPDIVPVNFVWHDGAVLFRSGPGPKLQAAERGETVAFEVDSIDTENHTAWSVVVVGRAEVLRKPLDDEGPRPWAHGPHRYVVRIKPSRIDGRRLT